jgi:hypothetical protein
LLGEAGEISLADPSKIIFDEISPFFALRKMAEGEGFEPPVPLLAHMISSHAQSTGLCHPSGSKPLSLPKIKYLLPSRSAMKN